MTTTLRAATDADRPFLLTVYGTLRAAELAQVPWPDEVKSAFVAQQFHAQDTAYRNAYPGADFLVVEVDGVPIGRLYRYDTDTELHVLDIALLPEWCGRGIGSALLADVLAEADASGRDVGLFVERWNPAKRLYERLGFTEVGSDEIYIELVRRPAVSSVS